MNFKRYIIRFRAPTDIPALAAYDGTYHCAGLPNDPRSLENAMLMSEKALAAAVKAPRFKSILNRGVTYDVIPVNCTVEL